MVDSLLLLGQSQKYIAETERTMADKSQTKDNGLHNGMQHWGARSSTEQSIQERVVQKRAQLV
jgi:hypothetical protein